MKAALHRSRRPGASCGTFVERPDAPRRHARKTRRGVAAVEFAAVLPAVMVLLMGIIEVGRLIEIQQVLSNACREGVRQASTGQLTNTQVQAVVTQYVTVAGFSTTGMIVTVTDVTQGGDVSAASYLDRLQVSSTYPYQNVAWSTLNYVFPSNYSIYSQAVMISMVDKPFPTFPNPPVG
jgi:Flp pilus assembly protein TadG